MTSGDEFTTFGQFQVDVSGGSSGFRCTSCRPCRPPVADRKHRKMDMQFDSCHGTTFLDFEDVRVPKSNLIGQEGGWVSGSAGRTTGGYPLGIVFYRCWGPKSCHVKLVEVPNR